MSEIPSYNPLPDSENLHSDFENGKMEKRRELKEIFDAKFKALIEADFRKADETLQNFVNEMDSKYGEDSVRKTAYGFIIISGTDPAEDLAEDLPRGEIEDFIRNGL